jgi:Pyruvate/2-oxoglutarate dehydrogenase complex, dihydrolipoamide acyltransferase (E2) component, and related enzymes
MADIKTFYLPDLGEGLPDATVVEWHVKEGDSIKLDAPLCSMETAKAVVDVPSPYTGTVTKLHGARRHHRDRRRWPTSSPTERQAARRGRVHRPPPRPEESRNGRPAPAPAPAAATADREDEGTVVGAMVSGSHVHVEQAASIGGVKAVPAVRALAKKLKIDLARVRPSGEAAWSPCRT